ncbi:TPA: hypothetical protein ACGUV0_004202 [Vibrio vulnificus]
MRLREVSAIVALSFVSGCATTLDTISSVDVNNLQDNQAVILFSAGSKVACKFNTAQIVVKESSKEANLASSIAVYQLNNAYIESVFDDEYGLVYSTVLKPGNYDFWLSNTNPFVSYKNPMLTESVALKPKEVMYLGEFYSDNCGGDGDLNVTINNKSERDLRFINQHNGELDINNVTIAPATIIRNND